MIYFPPASMPRPGQHLAPPPGSWEARYRVRHRGRWSNHTFRELLSGKTVAVFSPPPSLAPPGKSPDVARFDQLADRFRELGVSDLICLAVIDSFLLDEWEIDEQVDNVRFLSDSDGRFLAALGVDVERPSPAFFAPTPGRSMMVHDGRIERLFVDNPRAGRVADADTLLYYRRHSLAMQVRSPAD